MIGIRGGVGGNAGPVSLSPSPGRLGRAMRTVLRCITVVVAIAALGGQALAAAPQRCTWAPRSISIAPATDESRVADWIVERILKLAADSGPVVEISPLEVAAATGVDLKRVDPDQVGRQVRERLRELGRQRVTEHENSPAEAVPPPAGAPAETSTAMPQTQN